MTCSDHSTMFEGIAHICVIASVVRAKTSLVSLQPIRGKRKRQISRNVQTLCSGAKHCARVANETAWMRFQRDTASGLAGVAVGLRRLSQLKTRWLAANGACAHDAAHHTHNEDPVRC
jgi:hypothetical protein